MSRVVSRSLSCILYGNVKRWLVLTEDWSLRFQFSHGEIFSDLPAIKQDDVVNKNISSKLSAGGVPTDYCLHKSND
jgi:hypothetical protein